MSVRAQSDPVLAWLRGRAGERADLRLDTRALRPGDVFLACPGRSSDGRRYIDEAIRRGASAIVMEAAGGESGATEVAVPTLAVENLRAMLGELANAWYGQPSHALTVIAVTGTNGKTSCVQWLAGALNAHGVRCATVGTLGAFLPDGTQLESGLTTPDVLSVHRLLAALRDAGAEAVAMEASSIGLEQGRLDAVQIKIAGFTNLTRDHLDYHGTMQAYEAAKAMLFARPDLQAAVINVDDAVGHKLASSTSAPVLSYSMQGRSGAAIRAEGIRNGTHGLVFNLVGSQGEAQVVTRLVGEHNVANLLLVAGVLTALRWPLAQIAAALSESAPVDGRLQTVDPPAPAGVSRGPLVVVDYAHTPDALARALQALRPLARARQGRLVCVFGCGGNRDAGKRPEMGRVVAGHADVPVLTSDNPRDEDPQRIIDDVLHGMPAGATVIAERARAILHAVWAAQACDVVLLAGKGHETYQEAQGERLPFDDREWAKAALLLAQAPGVSTDTRTLAGGQVFVALSGERFDGHDYLAQAQAAGACAAIVARPVHGVDLPQVVLGETRRALATLAGAWRARFALPVVAVTGSNGKTTTKEMIAAILAAWVGEDARLATAGNLNNDIGVPLTLLRLRETHRAAVVELGMNHPGEIAGLAALAAPTVGLVNNAQREHQEFMGTVEAVARENGCVLQALPEDGVAVYPVDDAHAFVWDELCAGRRRLRFGLRDDAEVHAVDIHAGMDFTACRVVTPDGVGQLRLPVPGQHNLRNALAAIACALAAGAPLQTALQALAGFRAVAGRMQHRRLPDGTLLIDDTYNANPDSVRAAIDVLAQLPGPRVLVLGDMGEVGENGPAMHAEVGSYARERGVDALYTLGQASRESCRAFGERAQAMDSPQEIVQALAALRPASILVKGSRFMRMERIVKSYIDNNQTPPGGRHAA